MPEDDYVWLPREDMLHFEEISALVDVFIVARRRQGAADRRRAAAAPRPADAGRACSRRKPGLRDLALTTNGVLLADQIDALKAAGLRRITVSLDTLHRDRFMRADALRRARRASTTGIAAARRVVRPAQDRHRRHPRRQRRRAGRSDRVRRSRSTPRSGSSNTWTSAAPRTGRRTRVVSRGEMLDALTRRYGADRRRSSRRVVGAGRSLRAARRHDVRHHLVDDRAVLPHLRPQPADRRRHVVPVPLRDAAASTCARRCARGASRRRTDGAHRRRLARPDRSRRRRAAGARRPARVRAGESLRKDPHLEMQHAGR